MSIPLRQIPLNISKIQVERHHPRCWPSLSRIIISPSGSYPPQQHCVSFLLLLTRYKKLSDLKENSFIFLPVPGVRIPKRICKDMFLLRALVENAVFVFSSYGRPPASSARGPFSSFKCSRVAVLNLSLNFNVLPLPPPLLPSYLLLWPFCSPGSYVDFSNCIESTWIIQDNLPHLRILSQICKILFVM